MEIEQLTNEYMTNTGSTVLNAIQNNETPILDLLIRESIQNSLDAKQEQKSFVKTEINVGNFDNNLLSKEFKGIEGKLIKQPNDLNKFISLRDSNTIGLTGPVSKKDVTDNNWGNFLKLIRYIGKPQENESSGGSWGYGKTVYYRLGIGLVIFYSRIKDEEGKFESRLMACLIENEKKENPILPEIKGKQAGGIAWWGEKTGEELLPITDESKINEILTIFNISLYRNQETGTTVIIPYINERTLLKETYSLEETKASWCNSIEDYLKVATERWYPTRLMNRNFKDNPWLDLYINNEEFDINEMLPLFRIIQELYNYNNYIESDYQNIEIFTENIKLNSIFSSSTMAGNLIYTKLSKEQLKMIEPDNEPSPFIQIDNELYQQELNKPIITFCRKPGMILRYDYAGEWSNRLENVEEGTVIVALFVPCSKNIIKLDNNDEGISLTLEEYLRSCEKADHDNWEDIRKFSTSSGKYIDTSNLRIIYKIQTRIANKLNEVLVKKEENKNIGVGTELNRQLATFFLPSRGFGHKANKRISDTIEKKIHRTMTTANIGNMHIENDMIANSIEVEIGKDKEFEYDFCIDTENKKINAIEWEKQVENEFPLKIVLLLIKEIYLKDGSIVSYEEPDMQKKINFNFKRTTEYSIPYGFEMQITSKDIEKIVLEIKYKSKDVSIQYILNKKKEIEDEQ